SPLRCGDHDGGAGRGAADWQCLAARRAAGGVRGGSAGRAAVRALRPALPLPGAAAARAAGQHRARGPAPVLAGRGHGLRRCGGGVSSEDTVVLYGGNNNWFASYAYWYFKLYGHDKVLLLDGGRKKWELDSRELTRDVPERARTSYQATEQDASLRALRDEVIAAIGKRNLVDVRSPDEFTGRLLAPAHLPQEQAQRAGHIPTARNVPWSKAANEDGTFRSDDELRSLYQEEAGLDFGRDTIAYCRIGERSAHTWFVLHELLDLPNVKNYDGSWTEYGSLVGVPIELAEA